MTPPDILEILSPARIAQAAELIAPHVRRTPVMALEGRAVGHDAPVALKLECLQHAGSFKPRGAFMNLLSRDIPESGVVAASGGNHGAAVAYAARALGYPARIYVPEISSPAKIALIRAIGADLRIGGAVFAQALAMSEADRAATGAAAIHAYDAPETLLGQATLGREFAQQAPDLDTVLVAVGGGGLIAGIAAWYAGGVKVVAAEPETSRALNAALTADAPRPVEVSGVAADSLGASQIGDLPFAVAKAHVAQSVLVSNEAIRETQLWCWRSLSLAVEPGGAAALAALRSGAYRPESSERVGVVMCGANVDLAEIAALASG